MTAPILKVENLHTYFALEEGRVEAVNDVSFEVQEGEIVGLVGESGCGKSVTSLSVMRLIPSPPGHIADGRVLFKGQDILSLRESEMCSIRGGDVSMIFQEPMTSLNPVITIGEQIKEAIHLHQHVSGAVLNDRAVEILEMVGIPRPEEQLNTFPHQMSGGMRQRIMIAIALSCKPDLLIADEPTTALDVTIQAQILELLLTLQKKMGMALLLITHNLGVVADIAQRVLVMYAGRIIESGPTEAVIKTPQHPYTIGLIKSIPQLSGKRKRLHSISGHVPNLIGLPQACPFEQRCPHKREKCTKELPELTTSTPERMVRCFYWNSL